MREFESCEEVRNDTKIVLTDSSSRNNYSKFCLHNPQRLPIKVIRVDGCLPLDGKKCDHLIILPNEQEIYIELKGSRIEEAIEQICNTIKSLKCNCNLLVKLCFIACTRCPINSTEIQNLKKKIRQRYNASITIKNGTVEHTYP